MNEIIQADYGVIVFHDKTAKFITEDQFSGLVLAYSNDKINKIQIGNSFYSKSSISKILTLDEYRKEYPTQVPDRKYENQFEKYESITQRSIGPNGLSSMMRGLKRFMDEAGKPTPNAKREYDRLTTKFQRQYGTGQVLDPKNA